MYAKLFSRITESSLMEESIPVRYVFVMLLAIADQEGYVIGTDIAIARRLNMPVADFRQCVEELMTPDPDSNSKEEEGRRVILSDHERGYKCVNYRAYRDMKDEQDRREYMREYMRKRRSQQSKIEDVNSGKPPLAELGHAEAGSEAEAEKENRPAVVVLKRAFPEPLRDPAFMARWEEWETHLSEISKPLRSSARNAQLSECARHGRDEAMKALQFSISKNKDYIAWEWASDAAKRSKESNGSTPKALEPDPPGWKEWIAANERLTYTPFVFAPPNRKEAFASR